jgi:putative acetyltransferase
LVDIDLVIAVDDPRAADVSTLVEKHLSFARGVTPDGHVHALEIGALEDPAVTFYSARREGVLLGVAALKRLDDTHAELKSMHTGERARRQGVGQAMVRRLLADAIRQGYVSVSLETGTMDAFAAARRLYARAGFQPCEPFGEYTANPHSTCMRIDLSGHLHPEPRTQTAGVPPPVPVAQQVAHRRAGAKRKIP